MPRYQSFDPTIEDCLTIKISALNSWGYLTPNLNVWNRTYFWEWNGERVASIGYAIHTVSEDLKRMTLHYKHEGKPVTYSVDIVATPTNLGKGKRWYFICPKTGKRCMNLINPEGSKYFWHRTAFPELLYDSQKKSKAYRAFEKQFGPVFEIRRLEEQLSEKYRKTHYRGEPTPLVKKIEEEYEKLGYWDRKGSYSIE